MSFKTKLELKCIDVVRLWNETSLDKEKVREVIKNAPISYTAKIWMNNKLGLDGGKE